MNKVIKKLLSPLKKNHFFQFRYNLYKAPQLKKVDFGGRPILRIQKKAQVVCGKNVTTRSFCSLVVNDGAKLTLGDNVFLNSYTSINCLEEVTIGKNTKLGEGVRIYDHNHKFDTHQVYKHDYKKAAVVIGENCWIGSNAVILKGVTIGQHSVIGAGCVIHKDVPPYSVVVANQDLLVREISD